jgi:hypothetical protein
MSRNLIKYILLTVTAVVPLFFIHINGSWADNDTQEILSSNETDDNEEGDYENTQFDYFEKEYGENLMQVPYAMRFSFANKTGMSWNEASYEERGGFISDWKRKEEADQIAEQNRQMAIDNDLQIKERQKLQEKTTLEQKEMQRQIKKQNEEMKEERKKMDFEQKLQDQKAKLDRLRNTQRKE